MGAGPAKNRMCMRRFLLCAALSAFCCVTFAAASAAPAVRQTQRPLPSPSDSLRTSPPDPETASPPLLDSLIRYAKHHLGIRYRSGGRSATGFDCSGFTSHVFSRFGFEIPRSSAAQATVGEPVRMGEMQKGDLIFFKGRNRHSRYVGHVGIVISEKGEKTRFIHASCSQGISIATTDSLYYKTRLLKVKRLIENPLPEPCTP